jgi:16S rRNA (adenine1518-N6/adenine1519-N6)-dimethyltransferase
MSDFIPAKKALGQNFLVDPDIIDSILDAALVGPEDSVLEIGPGLGAMTRELVSRAGSVTAIELDERLFHHLKHEFAHAKNLDLILGDALAFPYEELPGKVKVVANLPYYISTPIISRLIQARERISLMALMLQKEVAERITASPGGKDYGYLSVMVQLYAKPRIAVIAPASAFKPVPKVDSAVVLMDILPEPAINVRDYRYFERVVSAAFSQRRKTLKNTLKASRLFTDEGIERMAGSGIDPSRRAETLSLPEFAAIAEFLFEFRKA